MKPITRTLAMLAVLAALCACGGTSDPGTSASPAPNPSAASGASAPHTQYTVGGTATGLSGNGLILAMSDGTELPIQANGTFTFPESLPSGSAYGVTIEYQPTAPREFCTITNGSGAIGDADITNISVTCTIASGFVYATDPGNQIRIYAFTPGTGSLIPDGTLTIAADIYGMLVAPGGKFLYVLSRQPDQISIFEIDQDRGGLTEVNSIATDSAPCCMTVSPNGSFMFLVDMGTVSLQTMSATDTVHTYMVDPATGALTAAGVLQLAEICGSDACPGSPQLAVRPDSKYLYILNADLSGNTTSVTPYAIDPSTGGLTAGTATTLATTVADMAVDPLGRFLYVANSAATSAVTVGTTVLTYNIDPAAGTLTAAGSGTALPSNGGSLIPDPTGRFLYVMDSYNLTVADDNISALAVDPSSGALSRIGTPVETGSWPGAAAIDPSGAFLFVANEGYPDDHVEDWSDLTSFTIAASGASAGALSLAGLGAQIPSTVQGEGGFLAIVE